MPPKRAAPAPLPDIEELATAHKDARTTARLHAAAAEAPTWPEDTTWHPQPHYLGGGGYGKAHLWLAVDDQNRITDRKVVKDCWLSSTLWSSMHEWIGNPSDVRTRKHREIYFHEKFHLLGGRREGARFLARMFQSRAQRSQRKYRLYLQYYPHRDFYQVVRMYIAANSEEIERVEAANAARAAARKKKKVAAAAKKKKGAKGKVQGKKRKPAHRVDDDDQHSPDIDVDADEEPNIRMIPEPFIWYTLESLAQACLVLEHGSSDPNAPEEDWSTIIHRDIKTLNIFLDAPDSQNFPSYPRPILADFGLAVQTHEHDERNPVDFVANEGSSSFQTPEQLPMMHRTSFQLQPIDRLASWTNVWGIGAIAVALMNRENTCRGTFEADLMERRAEPEVDELAQQHYSQELVDIVRQCTRYLPRDRIGLRELLDQVVTNTTPPPPPPKKKKRKKEPDFNDFARGMRGAEHEEDDEELGLLYRDTDHAYEGRLVQEALDALAEEAAETAEDEEGEVEEEAGEEE